MTIQMTRDLLSYYKRQLRTSQSLRESFWIQSEINRLRCVIPTHRQLSHKLVEDIFDKETSWAIGAA